MGTTTLKTYLALYAKVKHMHIYVPKHILHSPTIKKEKRKEDKKTNIMRTFWGLGQTSWENLSWPEDCIMLLEMGFW